MGACREITERIQEFSLRIKANQLSIDKLMVKLSDHLSEVERLLKLQIENIETLYFGLSKLIGKYDYEDNKEQFSHLEYTIHELTKTFIKLRNHKLIYSAKKDLVLKYRDSLLDVNEVINDFKVSSSIKKAPDLDKYRNELNVLFS